VLHKARAAHNAAMARLSGEEKEFVSNVAGLDEGTVRSGEVLDMRALPSPIPLVRLYRTLNKLQAGAEIKVLTGDRGTVAEFQAFARMTGHALLDQHEDGGRFVHVFRRR
jgi:tRNA 2-thiouridine synthesizing protein A